MVLHSDSSVTVDEITGLVTFAVTFKRQFITRGIIQDSPLAVSRRVTLDYGVAKILVEDGTDFYDPKIVELMETSPDDW